MRRGVFIGLFILCCIADAKTKSASKSQSNHKVVAAGKTDVKKASPVTPTQAADSAKNENKVAAKNPEISREVRDQFDSFVMPGASQKGIVTDGVLIRQNGQTIYERYNRGFGARSRHLLWSVSKSITAALVGAAVDRKILSLEDSICRGSKTPDTSDVCKIKVVDLLSWSSGIQWNEGYEKSEDRSNSSVIQMLLGDGRDDMMAFYLGHPLRWPAGTRYLYSTGDSVALMGVLKNVMANQDAYDQAPWQWLFEPLAMNDVTFEQDLSGTFVGGSFVYASAPDLASFGEMLLNDGRKDQKQILPASWVQMMKQPAQGYDRARDGEGKSLPLRHLWRPVLAEKGKLPADTFSAEGHWGQFLIVIPSLKLVAVRLADDRDDGMDVNSFAEHVVALVKNQKLTELSMAKTELKARGEAKPTDAPKYSSTIMRFATYYGSRMYCSCRVVTGQGPEFCEAFVKADPDIVRVQEIEKVSRPTFEGAILKYLWPTRTTLVHNRLGCR